VRRTQEGRSRAEVRRPEAPVLLQQCRKKAPDAQGNLSRLDSLMLTGPPYRHDDQSWNLLVARLKEAQGNNNGPPQGSCRLLKPAHLTNSELSRNNRYSV